MNNIELEDRLYTSTEVANVLGVSLRSVYRYLEDGKLVAEMKTATGRHRFTKQNILDFLSPQPERKPPTPKVVEKVEVAPEAPATPVAPPEPTAAPVVEETPVPAAKEASEGASSEAVGKKEEEVDWLSKFRGAAEKYKAEAAQEKTPKAETVSGLGAEAEPAAKEEPAVSPNRYYKSADGGLKDLAQNLDKSAKKASLGYAFTLDAGLSLHKPIKPFSLLHSYVKSEDLAFFEKILSLGESSEADAQLCLIVSDDSTLYSGRKEIHGLNVVSDERLKEDLIASGKEDLAKEL